MKSTPRILTVVQVMRPVTIDYLTDDYQDARILDETREYVELEVIHYPLNTVASAIVADAKWRESAARMKSWTDPGITANWNAAMRDALRAGLRKDGIPVDELDDKTLVERASTWLCKRAKHQDGFTTFVTAFDADKRPVVPQELLAGILESAQYKGRSFEQQCEREIFARGMFEQGVRGSCSSSAIYLNGCLRALGVPTRIVLCIPLVDANDDAELRLLHLGLTHRRLEQSIDGAIKKLKGSWASHTFNEVFVGGRWRRLNYDRLGQDILDPGLFGLMTHVATFSDWADARMPETIGRRQKLNLNNDVFGGPNPYSALAVRDEFGPHCKVANEPAAPVSARIAKISWHDAEQLPDDVTSWFKAKDAFGLVARVEGLSDVDAFRSFLQEADHRVHLKSQGHPTLGVGFDAGCWWWKQNHGLIVIPFGTADRRDLASGVPYRFVPRNDSRVSSWIVADEITIVRKSP